MGQFSDPVATPPRTNEVEVPPPGWLLAGPAELSPNSDSEEYSLSNLIIERENDNPFELVNRENRELLDSFKQLWEIETGTNEIDPESYENLDQFDIKYNGERYEVGLPWRTDIAESLSTDYLQCLNRLKSLHARLKRDPELLHEYHNIIKEQLRAGVIDLAPKDEEKKSGTHFMPHHGVVRKDRKTTKLRIVFDGSAKGNEGGLSLNEHLENGPNFIPPLYDVLVKFRCRAVGIIADVEKAFHQIEIRKSNRDQIRFLWLDDVDNDNPSIVQFNFCRLPFGLKPSPSILGGTIRKHLSAYEGEYEDGKYDKIVQILRDLYVDDLNCSTNSNQEAFEIYSVTNEIMKQGGFNFRKWQSNSKVRWPRSTITGHLPL